MKKKKIIEQINIVLFDNIILFIMYESVPVGSGSSYCSQYCPEIQDMGAAAPPGQ
jgi:hypothetical protein